MTTAESTIEPPDPGEGPSGGSPSTTRGGSDAAATPAEAAAVASGSATTPESGAAAAPGAVEPTAAPAARPLPPSAGTATAAGNVTGSARTPAPRPGTQDVQLQAISAQDGHPVAVLNGQLVREGDTIEGMRVVRIGADEVEIEIRGRRRVVKF